MRLLTIADNLLGLFSLLAGGFVGLTGAVLFSAGAYSFVVGVHGGSLYASVMTLFGAAMLFIGWFCGLHGFKNMRQKNSRNVNSHQGKHRPK
jgi:hypothetical protein